MSQDSEGRGPRQGNRAPQNTSAATIVPGITLFSEVTIDLVQRPKDRARRRLHVALDQLPYGAPIRVCIVGGPDPECVRLIRAYGRRLRIQVVTEADQLTAWHHYLTAGPEADLPRGA